MSCCGDRRAAMRSPPIRRVMPEPPDPPRPQDPVQLAPRGDSAIVMRGEVTGLTYLFGAWGAALTVDGRDVPALMATGWFRRA